MKKKLTILIYSLASGGAEKVVSILLNELKERYDITLFLMNDTIFYDIPKNIKIVYLENSDPKESGIKKLLKLPLLAWKYKRHNNFSDISFSFMNRPNYINILAKMMGMKSKVLISERAMPTLQHKYGVQGRINRFLIKTLYKKANIITANSQGNRQDLVQNFSCKEVMIINNLFDLTKIEKLSKEKVNFRDDKFSFITIGRLDNGKNHKLLIEVMKSIDAKLYIIGDGELRSELEHQIKRNSLENKVVLLGRQINPYSFLAQADCFVFSSSYEGFPNVLVEALACQLPVISTDCQSGPREILALNYDANFQQKDNIEIVEHGILTPIKNKTKLKEAMNLMINDKKLLNRYQQKAKQRANDFKIEKIIKQYEKILCAV